MAISLEEIKEILEEFAGADDDVDLTGDITNTEFTDLGFDSLAIIETLSELRRRHGLRVPDDAAADMHTPDDMLRLVNDDNLQV